MSMKSKVPKRGSMSWTISIPSDRRAAKPNPVNCDNFGENVQKTTAYCGIVKNLSCQNGQKPMDMHGNFVI